MFHWFNTYVCSQDRLISSVYYESTSKCLHTLHFKKSLCCWLQKNVTSRYNLLLFSIHLAQRPSSFLMPLAKKCLVGYELSQAPLLSSCHHLETYDLLQRVLNFGRSERGNVWSLSRHYGSLSTLKQFMWDLFKENDKGAGLLWAIQLPSSCKLSFHQCSALHSSSPWGRSTKWLWYILLLLIYR